MKKHIVEISGCYYAADSITAATAAVAALAKLTPVEFDYELRCYRPTDKYESLHSPKLETNQPYRPADKPKTEKPAKALALPAPNRGSILCLCEHSYVAPRQSCPHCGRDFAESHARTHETTKQTDLKLLP
jgi:hypothetical protein